jgi:hypothetical protein
MKNIIQYATKIILWVSLIISQLALAAVDLESVYFGVDIGVKRNDFIFSYGGNLFKSTQPLINIFIGGEVIQNLNLEINAQKTLSGNRQLVLPNNQPFLGLPPVPDAPGATGGEMSYITNIKISSVGTNLIYKFNPMMNCENFNILFGVGMKLTKAYLNVNNIGNGNIFKLTKYNNKALVKVSAGWVYMFTDNYGIRGLVCWENTSILQPTMIRNGVEYKAKFKNSLNYTLGLLYRF